MTEITEQSADRHRPTALKRNRSYETFQLYAEVGHKTKFSHQAVFCEAVRLTLLWLADRFRQNEIPDDLQAYVDMEEIMPEDLRSIRIDEGYIIDIAYIDDEGVWALHLTEPDQGSQSCAPMPGRTFETNFAFRLMKNKVEFATKTICSQPDDNADQCEVFRPAVVKWLSERLGLTHHWLLRDSAIPDIDDMRKHIYRCRMPMVIFTATPEGIDIKEISRKLFGFAHVFRLDDSAMQKWNKEYAEIGADFESRFYLRKNECLVIYPFKGRYSPAKYNEGDIRETGPEGFQTMLLRDLSRCNFDLKELQKGSVLFYSEARRNELKEREKICAEQNDIRGMAHVIEEMKQEFKREIERRDKKIHHLKQRINDMKFKKASAGGAAADEMETAVDAEDYIMEPAIPLRTLTERYHVVLMGGNDGMGFFQNLSKRNPNLHLIEATDQQFDESLLKNADFIFKYKDCLAHATGYRAEPHMARVPHADLKHHTNIEMIERAMANALIRHFEQG